MSKTAWAFVTLLVGAAVVGMLAFLQPPSEEEPRVVVDASFDRTGNLVINNPDMEPGVWYLAYEEPGQPVIPRRLRFTTESICSSWLGEITCQPDTFDPGERVRVLGEPVGSATIRVLFMEFQ